MGKLIQWCLLMCWSWRNNEASFSQSVWWQSGQVTFRVTCTVLSCTVLSTCHWDTVTVSHAMRFSATLYVDRNISEASAPIFDPGTISASSQQPLLLFRQQGVLAEVISLCAGLYTNWKIFQLIFSQLQSTTTTCKWYVFVQFLYKVKGFCTQRAFILVEALPFKMYSVKGHQDNCLLTGFCLSAHLSPRMKWKTMNTWVQSSH